MSFDAVLHPLHLCSLIEQRARFGCVLVCGLVSERGSAALQPVVGQIFTRFDFVWRWAIGFCVLGSRRVLPGAAVARSQGRLGGADIRRQLCILTSHELGAVWVINFGDRYAFRHHMS